MVNAQMDAEQRRAELKAKLAEKKNASHKTAKGTKAQQKVAEDEKKAKAEAEAKAKTEKEAAIKAKAAEKAKAPPPPPSVWANETDEASQIGIHVGITCDGCGQGAPLFGKTMKCKDCPDFDLCEKCYPLRLDKHREAISAAAGLPGKGKHPAAHSFGPRKAHTVLTREAVAAELAAAEESEKLASAKKVLLEAQAAARRKREADGTGTADLDAVVEQLGALLGSTNLSPASDDRTIWRPSPHLAAELPTPKGHPRVLRPV